MVNKSIAAHKKIKHLTKKYRRFRYLKDKRKKIDLDELFKSRLNRKETKELNFSNFFSKLNELNKRDDSLDERNSSPIDSKQTVHGNYLQITNEDSENQLLEFIKASSTITNCKGQCGQRDAQLVSTSVANKKEGKKSSAVKHKEKTICLLNEFNRNEMLNEDRLVNEEILIDYFLNRIKDTLTKEEQTTFLQCLEEFDLIYRKLIDRATKSDQPNNHRTSDLDDELVQVYSKIKHLISDNNELIDEFLLFMNYELVKHLNKQFDFNYWIKVKNFVQKIAIYLNQDCGSLIRLLKLLKQLKQNETDLDKKRIRTALSKFLNSQPYLLSELNALFLEETPQDCLLAFNEDFDEIDLEEEANQTMDAESNDDQKFETINLSNLVESEQNYLTKECPCKFCHHQSNADAFDSQSKHCISCSLKYYRNKFYCLEINQKLNFTSIEYIEND